jgi:alpha-galactosidase
MRLKISFIGAGSVVFAKNLIGDILQFPELADATICLMDIDAARLKVAETMTRKMVAKLGVAARVEATMDQKRALRGARYVICAIQVGGFHPGTVLDFEIPRKYGLRQTIGDTLGVGGVFRGLRTIPVLNKIAEDIARVGAPGCLLLNYTNPMAMNCWGVDRAVGISHVGLCHSVQNTSRQLAEYAGIPYDDVTYLVAGINHMAFFIKFEYKGRDAYPLLFQKLDSFKRDKVRFEMMRRIGYFVTESSEHQSEYVPYFIHHGARVVREFDIPLDEYLRRCESIINTWTAAERQLLGANGDIEIGPQSHEYGAFIIHSRETGLPRTIYGNVPNAGLITNLPKGCCVEVPCKVDSEGLKPISVGDLPPQLAALCQTNINVQALVVEAAQTRKREHIYHAVMVDPHASATLTLDQIWAMCDELIAAHQKHGLLGEFLPSIPRTGRAYAGTGDRIIAELREDPKRKGAVGIAVNNPNPASVKMSLDVAVCEWGGGILKRKSINLFVGARKTIFKRIPLMLPTSVHEGVRVTAKNTLADMLVVDLVIPPRKILRAGVKEPSFEIRLAGSPAVKAWVADFGTKVGFRFQVDDSKVTLGTLPWSGSSLELFIAPENSCEALQVIVVPGKGSRRARLVNASCKPISGVKLSQKENGSGYELEAVVPKESLLLSPTATIFLLDCYANITALGGAHSGGRVSLSGDFHADLGTSAYSRVELNGSAHSSFTGMQDK